MADRHTQDQGLTVFDYGMMDPLFWLLERTKGVTQDPDHHPEGDVFTHSLQMLKWAFRESIDTDLILAAMLHDIGKYENTLGHDKIGATWLEGCASTKTIWLVKNHMRIWYFLLGDMRKLGKVKDLAEHPWLPELVLLARWDKLARNPRARVDYDRDEIKERLNRCANDHFNYWKGHVGQGTD